MMQSGGVDGKAGAVPLSRGAKDPEALIGTYGFFKVVSVDATGAFLNWGFLPDLFVPLIEQKEKMVKGECYIVAIFRDEKSRRIIGSPRIDEFVAEGSLDAKELDAVDLLICKPTDMGYKAIVNNDHWGLLYKTEVFQALSYGQRVQGFIKKVREDGKVDLSLQKSGYSVVPDLSSKILAHLQAKGGVCALTDNTPPAEIYRLFGISKKKFKIAVGLLYRKRLIAIEEGKIKLTRMRQPEPLPKPLHKPALTSKHAGVPKKKPYVHRPKV